MRLGLILIPLMTILIGHCKGSKNSTSLTKEDIRRAFDSVLNTIMIQEKQEARKQEIALKEKMLHIKKFNSPLTELSEDTIKAKFAGMVNLELINYLKERYGLTLGSISTEEKQMIRHEAIKRDICTLITQCETNKYRTVDGSCNNLKNPILGKAHTAYKRILPAEYEDGFNAPKVTSVNGEPLLSPRIISTTVVSDKDRPSKSYTHLFPLFGQFLTHDITSVSFRTVSRCCLDDSSLDDSTCFVINIPKDDYFYSRFNMTCLPVARATPTIDENCELGVRCQINKATSAIDASTIYGSGEKISKDLRAFKGGKLRSSSTDATVLPPNFKDKRCDIRENDPPCIKSGDGRANQHTMLSQLHQLWYREHNRIVGILANLNENWNDEILYQEGRRIVAAMMQHVIFNEFIPIVFGKRSIRKYGLDLKQDGFSYEYDNSIDLRLSSLFVGASWRMGHSLIQDRYVKVTEDRIYDGFNELVKSFKWPIPLYDEDDYDKLLRGSVTQPSQRFDNYFTYALTNQFSQNMNVSYGLDVVATNIQRGRDFALPSYTKVREFCKLKPIKRFEDLEGVMRKEAIRAFRKVYRDVDDIELYLAGVSEIPEEGEFMSPIVKCIAGRQFQELKYGDRFWYENGDMETSFTEDQLNEIRKSSLARVICDNTNIRTMQRRCFHQIDDENPLLSCIGGFIPRMSLEPWKDTGMVQEDIEKKPSNSRNKSWSNVCHRGY